MIEKPIAVKCNLTLVDPGRSSLLDFECTLVCTYVATN